MDKLNKKSLLFSILFLFVVAVSLIVNKNMNLSYASTVVDGNVTVDVSSYDGINWNNGDIKDVSVTVKFDDAVSENKKVSITIPQGMKYNSYEVIEPDSNISSQIEANESLKSIIKSINVPEQRVIHNYYYKVSYGTIDYYLDAGVTEVTFNLKISVDPQIYYGDKVFTEGIKASASWRNNESIGSAIMGVISTGSPIISRANEFSLTTNTKYSEEVVYERIDSNNNIVLSYGETRNVNFDGLLPTNDLRYRYYKSAKVYLYYPEGTIFDHVNSLTSNMTYTVDEDNFRVIVSINDWFTTLSMSNNRFGLSVTYRVPKIEELGSYIKTAGNGTKYLECSATDYAEITYYDDTIITHTLKNRGLSDTSDLTPYKVNVIDNVENVLNNARIINKKVDYYNSDSFSYGPFFTIGNTTAGQKVNQTFEINIDSTIEAIMVRIPYDFSYRDNSDTNLYNSFNYNDIINLEYKTNKKDWTSYNKSLLKLNTFNNNVELSSDKVNLDEDEYFTNVRATIEKFNINFYGYYTGALSTTGNSIIVGRLKSGENEGYVHINIYDDDDKENTIKNYSAKLYTDISSNDISSNSSLNFKNDSNVIINSISGGQSLNLSGDISINYTSYAISSLKNPVIYFTELNGMHISIDTLDLTKVSTNSITSLSTRTSLIKDEDYIVEVTNNNSDNTVYKISFIKDIDIGGFFTRNMLLNRIDFSVKAKTDLSTNERYNSRDILQFENANYVALSNDSIWVYTDILDVNKNNDTTDKVLSVYTNSLDVSPSKSLNVDTYITNENGVTTPYIEGDDNTLTSFSFGSASNYVLNVSNDTGEDTSDFVMYLPVPKTNVNFGSDFQNNNFNWDMILTSKGVSTNNEIYDILYSSDATNSNYDSTASYSSNPSDLNNIKMIKIEAKQTILSGSKTTFTFKYKINETYESAINGNKINATNIFNPVYSMVSPSVSGTFKGAKVGAKLVLTGISGYAYNDLNSDNIKNNDELGLSNVLITLYKLNIGTNSYEKVIKNDNEVTTYTNNDGKYEFDESYALNSSDTYAISFGNKSGYELSPLSNLNLTGTEKGLYKNINPSVVKSLNINASYIQYSLEDLSVTINDSSLKVGESINLSSVVTTTYDNSFISTYNWSLVDELDLEYLALSNTSNNTVNLTGIKKNNEVKIKLVITDIYGNKKNDIANIKIITNTPPTINAKDIKVKIGDKIDLTKVTAKDDYGENIVLTSDNFSFDTNIVLENSKTKEIGTYSVLYRVKDNYNNEGTKEIKIFVSGIESINANSIIINQTKDSNLIDIDYIKDNEKIDLKGSMLKPSNTVGNEPIKYEFTNNIFMNLIEGTGYTNLLGKNNIDLKVDDGIALASKNIDIIVVNNGNISKNNYSYINAYDFFVDKNDTSLKNIINLAQVEAITYEDEKELVVSISDRYNFFKLVPNKYNVTFCIGKIDQVCKTVIGTILSENQNISYLQDYIVEANDIDMKENPNITKEEILRLSKAQLRELDGNILNNNHVLGISNEDLELVRKAKQGETILIEVKSIDRDNPLDVATKKINVNILITNPITANGTTEQVLSIILLIILIFNVGMISYKIIKKSKI